MYFKKKWIGNFEVKAQRLVKEETFIYDKNH